MAIFGVVLFSLFAGISSGFSIIKSARENLRATQVMVEKMETIRLYTWEQINSNGFIPATFTDYYFASSDTNRSSTTYHGSLLITNTISGVSYATNLKTVTIDLTWTNSSGLVHTRSMNTLVSKNGLQDYIY